MKLNYSFIIPVYNRPIEIEELLQSILELDFEKEFEVVIIEDGSAVTSKEVIESFREKLAINYFIKENSGPGDSRNFGMERATGNYFLILDSDVILPREYLKVVDAFLNMNYCDCFGGPDAAHKNFSNTQKAINYAMTSFLTTGGVRGKKNPVEKFQPRSFNMGMSKKAFQTSEGFGDIHPGEDPDLSLRLNKLGFETCLISQAFVFHKRRIKWKQFYDQVYKFGLTRPILNSWHPSSAKIVYWFPTVFLIGFFLSFLLLMTGLRIFILFYLLYFLIIGIDAVVKNKNLNIGLQSVLATSIQFYAYGLGFFRAFWQIRILRKDPREIFPNLFFRNV